MATKASTTSKTQPSTYRAARMAHGYGREGLAAALTAAGTPTTMADVWRLENGTPSKADLAALVALPKRAPLVERTAPTNKPIRTKTAQAIAADAAAKASHPVTLDRKARGLSRELYAQALGMSTTALWRLETNQDGTAQEALAVVQGLLGKGTAPKAKPVPKAPAAKAAPAKDKAPAATPDAVAALL